MKLGEFRRRIRKLEQADRKRFGSADAPVCGPLILWTEELKEGTIIPPEGRVVYDYFNGVARARITFDPNDDGGYCDEPYCGDSKGMMIPGDSHMVYDDYGRYRKARIAFDPDDEGRDCRDEPDGGDPEQTIVPGGGRLVYDDYGPCWRARITFDPDDNGQNYSRPREPDETEAGTAGGS